MMRRLRPWVMLPTGWIAQGGLKAFRWSKGEGASSLGALMVLIVIAQHADKATGIAELTYDELTAATGLCRSKVAEGLARLGAQKLISKVGTERSQYLLADYDLYQGWGKLPASRLYTNERVWAFDNFRLRQPAELDALKLYLLFVALRDDASNLTRVSYEKITDYSGVAKNNIKRALSLLAVEGLLHVERVASSRSEYGIVNAYRLTFLDTRNHMGTKGRSDLQLGAADDVIF